MDGLPGSGIRTALTVVTFAAVNLMIPFLMIPGGVGAMPGVGGSAPVAKTLGEGDRERASRYFTMMMLLMLGTSLLCTVFGLLVIRPVACVFGATESMMGEVVRYGSICLLFNLALQAQYTFQSCRSGSGQDPQQIRAVR